MDTISQLPLFAPVPDGVEARWINPENPHGERGRGGMANHGRKGSACYGKIDPGQTIVLADYAGSSGVIRHIWTTTSDRSPVMNRGLKLDIYWDGAATPAISAPWSDFFGCGLGEVPVFESALFDNPEGRNFNSYVPMPFKAGFRMTVTNETTRPLRMFWMQIDLTINDPVDDALYLHACFNRQNPTALCKDYAFLPAVEGRGRFLGVNFGIRTDDRWANSWWGEGEVKLYVDGDDPYPTLCGTGCEDYIGTSWGQGTFHRKYQGSPFNQHGRICMYRYHIPDPIYFRKSIRGTIQQMGYYTDAQLKHWHFTGQEVFVAGSSTPMDTSKSAGGLFERTDDWSSCAYIYLDRPAGVFPSLMPVAERIADVRDADGTRRLDA
jgi:hypothetical protein